MSDSEDDIPLRVASRPKVSQETMSNASDHVEPGVSMAMGPVSVENDAPNGKRKATINGKESHSDSDDDVPLQKKRKTKKAPSDSEEDAPLQRMVKPVRATASQIGESSDEDVPLDKMLQKKKAAIEKDAEKEAAALRREDKRKAKAESDDDVPLAMKKPRKPKKEEAAKPRKAGAAKAKKEEDVKKPPRKATKSKAEPAEKKAKDAKTAEDEEAEAEEDEYRWWEDPGKEDDSIKWTTLEHNGVAFPPEYVPLPEHVKMRYSGTPVSLDPAAEEIAFAFGSMLDSTHNVENPTFQKNFFNDFKEMLDKTGQAKDTKGNKIVISDFEKCDFTPIFEHYDAERTAKKALPAAEKKRINAEKKEKDEPFMYCIWDGRKQKVGNFRIEPPGLFRGRGEHPKTGKFKKRVRPEQITINIGKEATVPKPPEGHKWKEVKHDQRGTWLAMWQENINGAYKYVMLAANSDVKGQSDYKKFEKARELKKHIDKIRKDYHRDLKSDVMAERQRATAVYLIDQFALRAGNEKGEDEADTVGCCSLKFEHVTLRQPDTVIFDFLGKDSIRFYDEVKVDPQVFKNLRIFKRPPKKEGDEIFDRLTTSGLNKHLSSYMPGLTAKVFRTYNASWTMSKLLKKMKSAGTVAERIKDYNDANREVAILCNHKRTVAASHSAAISKMEDKINAFRYQQYRLKQQMLDLDPKLAKKRGSEYFALPEGLDTEWVHNHQDALVEEQKVKIRKKFEKDNEKLVADGKNEMKESDLKERLQVAFDLENKFKLERKNKGKIEAEGKNPTVEKLEAQVEKINDRIATLQTQTEDRENNKEVALGTSKINYIDPRLTVVFTKKFDVPIEKLFSKTLREKFQWALKSVDETWEF
ncbi:hypothetical protein K470DRAFT_272146 [Piedraia hortae CBS 480.64]|uniref:DNA topoisomerase I n=1 Tax=Piedraia hortae CBS 480.64 TaxID=1314780 RepID=A0A6A7BU73_9PEZI|nr:hypothetical protein K470DRAFT_272146 [Piedraia hortae CBS 480.64]